MLDTLAFEEQVSSSIDQPTPHFGSPFKDRTNSQDNSSLLELYASDKLSLSPANESHTKRRIQTSCEGAEKTSPSFVKSLRITTSGLPSPKRRKGPQEGKTTYHLIFDDFLNHDGINSLMSDQELKLLL